MFKRDECIGTDPNRNFDVAFGESNCQGRNPTASNYTCDDVYHGQAPFSSAEAKAIKSAVTKIQEVQQLAAYLSFHSFAQVKAYLFQLI